jgi:hypothetical protein
VPVLVAQELQRVGVGIERFDSLAAPSGSTSASKRKPGEFSIVASASNFSPPSTDIGAQSRRDQTWHRASCNQRETSFCKEAPSTPWATSTATLRVRMPPSPGRAISDRAGDASTSGVAGVSSALGNGAGSSMPRSCATRWARSGAAFNRLATTRSRIAGTVTLESSKRKALPICAFSTSVWLSKNSRACV